MFYQQRSGQSHTHTHKGNHSLPRYEDVIVDYFHEQRQWTVIYNNKIQLPVVEKMIMLYNNEFRLPVVEKMIIIYNNIQPSPPPFLPLSLPSPLFPSLSSSLSPLSPSLPLSPPSLPPPSLFGLWENEWLPNELGSGSVTRKWAGLAQPILVFSTGQMKEDSPLILP